VVGEFLAGLNGASRVDENALAHLARLAIRPTSVVDVAGQMLTAAGINRMLGIDMEQIAATAAIGLLGADSLASILDNALAGAKRLVDIQAKATTAAPEAKVPVANDDGHVVRAAAS